MTIQQDVIHVNLAFPKPSLRGDLRRTATVNHWCPCLLGGRVESDTSRVSYNSTDSGVKKNLNYPIFKAIKKGVTTRSIYIDRRGLTYFQLSANFYPKTLKTCWGFEKTLGVQDQTKNGL